MTKGLGYKQKSPKTMNQSRRITVKLEDIAPNKKHDFGWKMIFRPTVFVFFA